MDDWLWMSMGDLGRGIARGDIDPVSLTETYLDAIAAHQLTEHIYARVTTERALAEAEAAAHRASGGLLRGPLDGVPVSWKDLFDTAGVATEAGSALLSGRVPASDAEVLRNSTFSGTVCLGKTHMSELAFSGLGYNPVTETPPCVNNRAAVSGGSSSGAAASVAFGLAPCGIGSDTGGSVRIPAAWNDLVGLKTTSGRLSLKGVVPLCARFDTVGPICRTVEDAALALAALGGGTVTDLAGAVPDMLRIGVLQTSALENLRPEPRKAYEGALVAMQAAGVALVPFEAPEVPRALSESVVVFTAEAYGTWREQIESAPEKMFDEILVRFRAGAEQTGPDYVRAWQIIDECRIAWNARVAEFDAVVIPTSPILPPDIERLAGDHEYYVKENLLALQNTRIGNMLGLCAITLPTTHPSCGVMLMGKPFAEEALLRVAAGVESAMS